MQRAEAGRLRRAFASMGRAAGARGGLGATLQTALTSALILGLNLGTGILTARALGPEGRGELAAIVTWPQFLAFALTLGLPPSLLYNLRAFPEKGRDLFSATVLMALLVGSMAAGVGALIVPWWIGGYRHEVIVMARWGMLAAPFGLFSFLFASAQLARHEFALYNLMRMVQPAICLTLLAALAVTGTMTSLTAAGATLMAYLPTTVWMIRRFSRIYPPKVRGVSWAFRPLGSYALRSAGVDLLGALTSQMDRAILVGVLDPALMGMYVVASSFSLTLNILPTAVVAVLFPRTSGLPVEEVIALNGRAARMSLLGSLLLALAASLAGPFLLSHLYGEEFLGAVPVMRLLLLEVVLRGTSWILAQAFMAVGKPGLVSVTQGVGFALCLPLMLTLVPARGLEGAGMALLLSTVARFVFVLACFPIALGRRPPRLRPMLSDFGGLLARVNRDA